MPLEHQARDGFVGRRFPAMGSEVLVVLPAARAAAVESVARLFEDWERRLSRFRPDSELARLNAADGRPVAAGPLLLGVLREALRAAAATDGQYDPCLGRQLADAGYARSFAERATWDPPAAASRRAGGAWRDVEVDARGRVRLPRGAQLDLGGIAKGMAVDAALDLLAAAGIPAALVSAGGDLAVIGAPAEGVGWPVRVHAVPGTATPTDGEGCPVRVHAVPGTAAAAVDGPGASERYLVPGFAQPVAHTVDLRAGALATSSTRERRWWVGGELRHHLLDPGTGAPVRSDLEQVTVAAASCRQAEVAAKVALILGVERGRAFLEAHGLAGLLVGGGRTRVVGAWPAVPEAA